MYRLSLDNIETQAADYTTGDHTLSPVSYILIKHALQLLLNELWLFEDAGDLEYEAVSAAIDELCP